MRARGKTSLRREGLVGAATLPEAKAIQALIRRHKLPPGVKTFEIDYGEDSAGDSAVWIWFHVRDEENMAESRVNELTDFVESIRSDLLASDLDRWPYVGFRNPSI